MPTYRHPNAGWRGPAGGAGPDRGGFDATDPARPPGPDPWSRSASLAALAPARRPRPVAAADPVVLRVGTTQDLDSLNPYATILVVGYEAFQLNYNLLVDFGPDLEPVPGFADSWERAADGNSWTFHIRDGMKWSDGQPATSEDACFSLAARDSTRHDGGGSLGAGLPRPERSTTRASPKVECPDPLTMIVTTDDPSDRVLQIYLPIIPKHIWGKETYKTIGDAKFDAAARRHRPVHGRRVADRPVHPLRAKPELLGARRATRTRSSSIIYKNRRHDGPGAQGR